MMNNNNNQNVVLFDLFKLSLSDSDMTCLLPSLINSPGNEYFHYIYSGVCSLDIVHFGGNFSLECLRHGQDWLRGVRLKNLILLGAGGAILYYIKRLRPPRDSRDVSLLQWPGQAIWDWLFAEELVEDPSYFYDSYNLHSYYFGPDPDLTAYLGVGDYPASSNDAEDEDSDDYSLNCVSNNSSPVKFLRRPLSSTSRQRILMKTPSCLTDQEESPVLISNPCPNCVKGTCRLKRHQLILPSSSSSSCYSGSPIYRIKTSTPEQHEEEQVLQRSVAQGRGQLVRRHQLTPGLDLRMMGDGCEDEGSMVSLPMGMSRDTSVSSLAELSSISVSNSMMDIVRDARQVRRLIREVSLDSQDSDLELELESREAIRRSRGDIDQFCEEMGKLIENCDEHEHELGKHNGTLTGDSTTEDGLVRDTSVPDFSLIQSKSCMNRRLWKLTGFSEYESSNLSEASENGSMEWDSPSHMWGSPSLSSKLEWDNEFSGNDGLGHQLDDDSSWLRSLDSCSGPMSRPLSRRSSISSDVVRDMRCMPRQPPSGRSSVGKDPVIMNEDDNSTVLPSSLKFNNNFERISRSKSGSFLAVAEGSRVSESSSFTWDPESPSASSISNANIMSTSATSLESGFQDCEASMTSSVSSMNSSISLSQPNTSLLSYLAPAPLSPVKECKEPRSPAKRIPKKPSRNKPVF